MSMSREGPAKPLPNPAIATNRPLSTAGSHPDPATRSMAAEALSARAMLRSRRGEDFTTKPPNTMPTALATM